MSGQQKFLENFKSGSKRFATLVADTGAKTMLKVRSFVRSFVVASIYEIIVCNHVLYYVCCSSGLLHE